MPGAKRNRERAWARRRGDELKNGAVKNAFPILAGIALLIVAIGITVHLTITEPIEKAADVPVKLGQGAANFTKYVMDKAAGAFTSIFQSQVHINSTTTVCDATPIAELAILKRNITTVVCYTNIGSYDSTKIIIAQQTFVAKIGFDLGSKSSASYDESNRVLTITLPPPKVLSLETVAPPIYYLDAGGLVNPVTDDDRNEVLRELKGQARVSADMALAVGDARQMLDTRFHDLFQSFGIKVIVNFSNNQNQLISPSPEPHL
jgi:hypothetical protein